MERNYHSRVLIFWFITFCLRGRPSACSGDLLICYDDSGLTFPSLGKTPVRTRQVIRMIETYDVTTIRASTPMFLMSRKIKALGIKMVLSGEGADEVGLWRPYVGDS